MCVYTTDALSLYLYTHHIYNNTTKFSFKYSIYFYIYFRQVYSEQVRYISLSLTKPKLLLSFSFPF